jgi:hypothetical protein
MRTRTNRNPEVSAQSKLNWVRRADYIWANWQWVAWHHGCLAMEPPQALRSAPCPCSALAGSLRHAKSTSHRNLLRQQPPGARVKAPFPET